MCGTRRAIVALIVRKRTIGMTRRRKVRRRMMSMSMTTSIMTKRRVKMRRRRVTRSHPRIRLI